MNHSAVSGTRRVGIFGGTFNPPHIGHVRAAEAFLSEMELDELLIMPAAIPPHKNISSDDSPELRLEMCQSAFGCLSPRITVSDYEIKKGGVSYTSETLECLAGVGVRLYLLCGTDMFLTLRHWHDPATIFSLAAIVCVPRENGTASSAAVMREAERMKREYAAEVHILSSEITELSSSDVRRMISRGENVESVLPDRVCEIIKSRGLYKSEL